MLVSNEARGDKVATKLLSVKSQTTNTDDPPMLVFAPRV